MPGTIRVGLVELVVVGMLAGWLAEENILKPTALEQLAVHVVQIAQIGEDVWHLLFGQGFVSNLTDSSKLDFNASTAFVVRWASARSSFELV